MPKLPVVLALVLLCGCSQPVSEDAAGSIQKAPLPKDQLKPKKLDGKILDGTKVGPVLQESTGSAGEGGEAGGEVGGEAEGKDGDDDFCDVTVDCSTRCECNGDAQGGDFCCYADENCKLANCQCICRNALKDPGMKTGATG